MADDKEKKIHSIIDKLVNSPESNPPSPSLPKITGLKRPYSAVESHTKRNKDEGIQSAAQVPPCRPWDRGDLMRRVATFKSMRWFAKPKVMDAVNCARRGWVNVDMDIIACEVCGARLQFSTPSTWTQQQVEKAALVSSLKLDNGHKLLCPWVDNACDENLALFQPLPAPVLVKNYKERSASLLQLSALPVISDSVTESMKSPQLEHFLKQSIAVEYGAGPNDSFWVENLGSDFEAVSTHLYYQAHRLLSLCGWEPRLLSYTVDNSEQPRQSANNKDISYMSHAAAGENNKLSVYVSDHGESGKGNEDHVAPIAQYDPNSTVLDCKLCGASIGLWAFRTVSRPLELIKVVGYAEIDTRSNNGGNNSRIENHGSNGKTVNQEVTLSSETLSKFSIAGGPPPNKQNFKATISLPVVGRNARAQISLESLEKRKSSEEVLETHDTVLEGSVQSMEGLDTESSGAKDFRVTENAGSSCQLTAPSDSPTYHVSEGVSEDNSGVLIENGIHGESSPTTVDNSSNLQQKSPDNEALGKDTSKIPSNGEKENAEGNKASTSLQKDVSTSGIDLQRHSPEKRMEFHPIKQHRHFCPWTTSTGTTAPGWQQTLSALLKEKVFVLPETEDSPPSPSLFQVDDPITSIRKLFESPPSKRVKPSSTQSNLHSPNKNLTIG